MMSRSRRMRGVGSPGLETLRHYWSTAVLLVATGMLVLATVLPVTSLAGPGTTSGTRLAVSPAGASDLGLHWSSNATSPATTRQQAVGFLFQLLLVAGVAALIIAALSILSLSAARASARAPEVSVRRAVGASKRTLLAASLLEGGLVAAAVLALGCALGVIEARIAAAAWPGTVAPWRLAPPAITALAVAGMILLGALFYLVSGRRRRIPDANPQPLELTLPALQLGMSLVVLTAGAIVVRYASRPMQIGDGPTGDGQVYSISAVDSVSAVRATRYAALLDQLKAFPGLETVSLTSPGAMVGMGMVDAVTTDCGACSQGGLPLRFHVVFTTHQFVSADTFGALGIRLLAGRGITSADDWDAPRVAVVSRGMANRHFQQGEAIGRTMRMNLDRPEWYTVVGIVDDRQPLGLGGSLQPRNTVYLSVLQHPVRSADLLVRAGKSAAGEAEVDRAVRGALNTVGDETESLSESAVLAAEAAPLTWFGRWFGVEGRVMLVIAAVGTFVLMRLWVLSLLPELGLRRAVGAWRQHLLGFILLRATAVGLAGTAIGLWFGPALWSTLPTIVPGLPAWDPWVVARLALLLVGTTLAGAMLPALRAARTTPSALIESEGDSS